MSRSVLRSCRTISFGGFLRWEGHTCSFPIWQQLGPSSLIKDLDLPWESQAGQQKKKCSQAPSKLENASKSTPLLAKILPKRALPYAELMRWDKPSATWLLILPCWWSVGLAAPCGSLPDISSLAILGTGAWLMRGAGCTINDMWDRSIDRKVVRTRSRPLASGVLTMPQAWVLLGAQLSMALAVCMQLNDYSKVMAASSASLAAVYPLMKRITFWPQAVLGLAMNWGALLGYSTVTGYCDWSIVVPLYMSGICWTIVYDTIYACQDIKDDLTTGVKSTALRFGNNMCRWLTVFSAGAVSGLVVTGITAGCGIPYFTSVACVGAHLGWQVAYLDVKNAPDCMSKFKSNKWLGAIIFSGIVVDRLNFGLLS